ncbi:hypothetical protein [Mycobacterium intracellulare]|uniref:hypothetical protein n=1 Tax=Mycobacterium intracellulare TaxID=1767 RepID=UPI001FF70601|nr:hypothetical protein [Mycobacterium intracellulare]
MTTTPLLSVDTLNVAAPPDAAQVHDWIQRGNSLPTRAFDGTVREASGFTVRVGGLQRANGTCKRWLTVNTESLLGLPLEPEAVRQLAAALTAAADELELIGRLYVKAVTR